MGLETPAFSNKRINQMQTWITSIQLLVGFKSIPVDQNSGTKSSQAGV